MVMVSERGEKMRGVYNPSLPHSFGGEGSMANER